ncbi:MAG: hypothetical protein KHW59_05290 [Clostridiales bacterium]|nr:hypothetical protein [Clostridiales bacterium]
MTSKKTAAHKKKKWHIGTMLLCVVCAFIIWLYVMEVDSPDYESEFLDVPVNLVGVSTLENEHNLSVFGGFDAVVDLKVKGSRSIIGRYTIADINVTADVSGITQAGSHEVALFFDLPSGLTMTESSMSEVSLYIDERSSAVVEVRARISSITIPESYELGDLVADTDTITVSGPKAILDDIDYAQVSLEAGSIESSVSMVGTLELISLSGDVITNPYIRLSQTEVRVNIPVYCYKELKLTAATKYGYYTEENTRITIEPEEVTVRGDPAVLAEMEELVVTTLDEKAITGDSSLIVQINVPDTVTLVEDSATATVAVRHVGTITKTFNVRNIDVSVDSGLEYEVLTSAVSVTVRGDQDAVNALSADDIVVSADLTGYTHGNMGLVYAEGVVTIDDPSGTVYELGEYNIQVAIQ